MEIEQITTSAATRMKEAEIKSRIRYLEIFLSELDGMRYICTGVALGEAKEKHNSKINFCGTLVYEKIQELKRLLPASAETLNT